MSVYQPHVESVSITPNPATINSSFLLSASVTDIAVVLYRTSKISGAAIAGEVITLTATKEAV